MLQTKKVIKYMIMQKKKLKINSKDLHAAS